MSLQSCSLLTTSRFWDRVVWWLMIVGYSNYENSGCLCCTGKEKFFTGYDVQIMSMSG